MLNSFLRSNIQDWEGPNIKELIIETHINITFAIESDYIHSVVLCIRI